MRQYNKITRFMKFNTRLLAGLLSLSCFLFSSTSIAQTVSPGIKSSPIRVQKNSSTTTSNRVSSSIPESMSVSQIDAEIARIDSDVKVVKADPIKNQKALNNNWFVLMNDRKLKLQQRLFELNTKK